MIATLDGADEPDPAKAFVADWSVVWPTNVAAANPLPYLYAVRDDTVPLTAPITTTSVASGNYYPQTYTWPPAST